jgi:hypothetical protein
MERAAIDQFGYSVSADGNRLSWGSPQVADLSRHARLFKAEVRCFAVSHRSASAF